MVVVEVGVRTALAGMEEELLGRGPSESQQGRHAEAGGGGEEEE